MSHNYNLRTNPKRRVSFSPPWPNSKRYNRQQVSNIVVAMNDANGSQGHGSENMSISSPNHLHDMSHSDQDVTARNNPRGSLNPEIPPFRPPQPHVNAQPFVHYQRFPPPHPSYAISSSNFPQIADGQDSNLANYIQNAIRDGLRSNQQTEPFGSELVTAIRAMTDRIDRGFENMQSQITSRNFSNINPSDVFPETDNVPRSSADQQEQEPSEENTVSRLESMVRSLSLQVSSLSQRLTNSNSTAASTSSRSVPYVAPNWNYRPDPQKWNVKFSGVYVKGSKNKMSATDFLNILSLKRETYDVTWEMIAANFDDLLEDRALYWYRAFRKRNSTAGWPVLKASFLQHFSRRETDEEILVQIANRKQGERESFDDFCDDMTDLRNQLATDYSDVQMIGLLRNNCKLGIRQMLATYSTTNLYDFIDKGKDCDKLLSSIQYPRRVHELQSTAANSINVCTCRPEQIVASHNNSMVEAIRNITCWNCDESGHGFMECEKERMLFCYKCGCKNVTCRTCLKCRNFRVQEMVSGDSPAQSTMPESMFPLQQ